MLCDREGKVYLGWLEDWQPYAEKTPQSSFASSASSTSIGSYGLKAPTPSYAICWRDIPVELLAHAAVRYNSNEEVRQGGSGRC